MGKIYPMGGLEGVPPVNGLALSIYLSAYGDFSGIEISSRDIKKSVRKKLKCKRLQNARHI